MNPIPIVLSLLLVAPALAPAGAAPREAALLSSDLSDGDLLRLLARHDGIHVAPSLPLQIPTGVTLEVMVTHLAQRAGLPPTDVEAFAGLDARIRVPTLELLVAIDQAWSLVEQSHQKLSREEQLELLSLARSNQLGTPRAAELSANIDRKSLYEAAILILDTLETTVLPQLDAASNADAWPATATTDSRCATVLMTVCTPSVLRIGSTSNDKDTADHILIIEPRGNDHYYNNAGGATLLDTLDPTKLQTPVALAIDLQGNDHYRSNGTKNAQGGAGVGIGILYEAQGDDEYFAGTESQGGALTGGIGYLRERSGDDTYRSGSYATGGGAGTGILREDHGNDTYILGGYVGGGAVGEQSWGLLWDRGGKDDYDRDSTGWRLNGWGEKGGRGWLIDEGPEIDRYAVATDINFPHGCNDCTWLAGHPGPPGGRGNDNSGGLAALLNEDGALPA